MIAKKLKQVKNGTYEKHKTTGTLGKMITPPLQKTGTVLIILNQVRDAIGVMFGRKEKMTGGNMNKHLQSLLLRMDIVGYAKERDEYGGIIRQKMRFLLNRWDGAAKCVFLLLEGEED